LLFLFALFLLLFAFPGMRIDVEISSEATQQRGQNRKKSSHGQEKKRQKGNASVIGGERSADILSAPQAGRYHT